jgi:hypothetical protein
LPSCAVVLFVGSMSANSARGISSSSHGCGASGPAAFSA